MADNREPLRPPLKINIEISAEVFSHGIGEYFRASAIVTAKCGKESNSWMMLPGPYDGPEKDRQFKEAKARWRTQLDWIKSNGAVSALSVAESLVIQAYRADEGVNTSQTRRKLQYTKRQAKRVKELLPERERFWKEARKNGLDKRDGIWPSLIEAFGATVPYKSSKKITKPKWKPGQIALVHAAMDAGVMLRNHELLCVGQWRTVKHRRPRVMTN